MVKKHGKEMTVMKKNLFLFGIAVLILAACANEEKLFIEEDDIQSLVFDIKVNYGVETKGKKTAWAEGDKVFIFFCDVTSGYLTITYDGTSWVNPALHGININHLVESGSTLTAVFLPFGNNSVPTYNENDAKWTFNSAADTYYLKADKQAYTVTKEAGVATLSATLNMTAFSGFIQFFVPDVNAIGTARLSCNNIYPSGLASISSDGTVLRDNSASSCDFITGYAATFNGDKGYYFYGCRYTYTSTSPDRYRYYFALEKNGEYFDYYKFNNYSDIGKDSSIKLAHMRQVGPGHYTTVGGLTWSTVNHGSSKPWEYDVNQYYWQDNNIHLLSGEAIPTSDAISTFASNTTFMRLRVGDVVGYLCIDKTGTGGYMFLPISGYTGNGGRSGESDYLYYWSSTEKDATDAYTMYANTWDAPYASSAGSDKNLRMSVRAIKP